MELHIGPYTKAAPAWPCVMTLASRLGRLWDSDDAGPAPEEKIDREDENDEVLDDWVHDHDTAHSILGGQAVEGRDDQRVFNFSLPFSAPWTGKFSLKSLATSLPLIRSTPAFTASDEDLTSDEEHSVFAKNKINPRSHALKK